MQDFAGLNPADLPTVLAEAATGDERAWKYIVESYGTRVYGFLLRRTRDIELAEELTQETFVKIAEKLNKFSGYKELGKFDAWLFQIAVNRLRDEYRRRSRQARAMGGSASVSDEDGAAWDRMPLRDTSPLSTPLDQVSQQEQIERVRAAVGGLNDDEQEVLYLRHTAGLSFSQIARIVNQPLGTVLARGHRALAKLRKVLSEADPAVVGIEQ